MIKRSIKMDIIFVNIYAPKSGVSKSIKWILTDLKGEIDSNKVMVGEFSTSLSTLDRSSRQKISKEIMDLATF